MTLPKEHPRAGGRAASRETQDDMELIDDRAMDLTHQERTSAHREPMLLMDSLATRYPSPGKHGTPTGIELRRTPDRCVIQADEVAVSVSWFAPRLGDSTAGELQIISWTGTVTMPGAPARPGKGATMGTARIFHLMRAGAGKWCWRGEGKNGSTYSSEDLVALCAKLLPKTAGPAILG
jgi:hypothetical protein